MSETMVETCALTLGELIDKDLGNEKFKKFSDEMQTLLKGSEGSKYQLTIPFYQRAYVWDTERVKILLEDLDEYLDMKSNESKPNTYLLGSLILHKNDENEFEVVDGQQRLVSLVLILLALGDKSHFLSESKFQHSKSKKHIKENYDFSVSWFSSKKGWKIEENEKHKKDIQKYKELLKNKIEFICILAPTLDDAFIFFDSVNAKGMRLEAYNLIKAFHLRALKDYSPKSSVFRCLIQAIFGTKPKDMAYFAKEFERLAKEKDGENLKILFNDTLTPARQWLRHNSDKVSYQMDIYNEFCTEIPKRFKSSPLIAKDSLGILQNFVGGVDFFEYLSHFHRLYTQLQSIEFYQKLAKIGWSGFIYNRYIYIMATLIYLNKFPNGRTDYMLRLIARAVFALRCSEERIYIQTARNFAKEILPLIYYASFEQELEASLCNFIDKTLDKERQVEGKTFDGGKVRYLAIMTDEYKKEQITPHHKKGGQNGE